ncbi:hypothetical protein [Halomonas sp.]|uniref:hypothetical protein n=1 Tax=Halomonas sp. TaxID=1486246 RepID=UPI0025BA01C3|nr:hypothetical protein [Halomonas sp.]
MDHGGGRGGHTIVRQLHQHPWHYDISEFIATMITRQSDRVRRFDYFQGIRSPEGENFGAVEKVIDDDRSRIRASTFSPAT